MLYPYYMVGYNCFHKSNKESVGFCGINNPELKDILTFYWKKDFRIEKNVYLESALKRKKYLMQDIITEIDFVNTIPIEKYKGQIFTKQDILDMSKKLGTKIFNAYWTLGFLLKINVLKKIKKNQYIFDNTNSLNLSKSNCYEVLCKWYDCGYDGYVRTYEDE